MSHSLRRDIWVNVRCSLAFTIFLLTAIPAVADDLIVHGLILNGVEAKTVEGDTVKLTYGTTEKLVSTKNYRYEGVKLAFSEEANLNNFSDEDLGKFIQGAVVASDMDCAVLGLEQLIVRESKLKEDKIFSAALSPMGKEITERLFLFRGSDPCVAAARSLYVDVVPNGNDITPGVITESTNIVDGRLALRLKKKDIEGAEALMPAVTRLSPEIGGEVKTYLASVQSLRAQKPTELSQELKDLITLVNKSQFLSRSGYPVVTDLVQDISVSLLEQNQPAKSLEVLSQISPSWRTDKTVEIVQNFLKTPDVLAPGTFTPEQAMFIKSIADGDSGVRQAVTNIYDARARVCLNNKDFEGYNFYAHYLFAVNPDPSIRNDELRFSAANAYLDAGREGDAKAQVDQVKSGLALGQRISLMFSGYYIKFGWVLLSLVAALLGGILIFLREKRLRVILAHRKIKKDEQAQAERERVDNLGSGAFRRSGEGATSEKINSESVDSNKSEFRPLGRKSDSKAILDPREIELLSCLRTLGLQEGATEKEIKHAFRLAAKEVHPDAQKSEGSTASLANDKFIAITKAYERSIALIAELERDRVMKEDSKQP